MTITKREMVDRWIKDRTRVEAGAPETQDHDYGRVVRWLDESTVEVAWETLVRTPCDVDSLREAETN